MTFFTVIPRISNLLSNSQLGRFVGALSLVALLGAALPVRPVEGLQRQSLTVDVDWDVEAEDSISGVREARQIKKPAVVDFDYLVGLTPEAKKIKRDKIDPNSAEGVRLMNQAKSKVRDSCSAIMKRQGYDSIWKKISSRKGVAIDDVTAYVEIEIKKK